MMSDKAINIVSLNIRGLGNVNKCKEVFNYLKQKRIDIACIQETHFNANELKILQQQWGGGQIIHSSGTTNSAGIAILIAPNSDMTVTLYYNDTDGRIIICEVQAGKRNFMLANLYGPNSDEPNFFSETLKKLLGSDCAKYVIAGDLNIALNPAMYRKDSRNYTPNAGRILNELLADNDIVDTWRIFNPQKCTYSWTRRKSMYSQDIIGSRIDYILTSQSLTNSIEEIEYKCGYKTDHSMVHLKFTIGEPKRGPGYWKFNKQLLHDHKFVNKANKIIADAPHKYRLSTP